VTVASDDPRRPTSELRRIAPWSNSGSISFTCSASSIIHAGGVPARRSSDQIGTGGVALALHA
jgi:hypothetical protein